MSDDRTECLASDGDRYLIAEIASFSSTNIIESFACLIIEKQKEIVN